MLIPREFTKLDEIIDLVFSTTEDVKEEDSFEQTDEEATSKQKPASFYEGIIKQIEIQIHQPLIRRSKTTYSTANETVRLSCAVSKEYNKSGQILYWFAFHPHQKDFIEKAETGYVTFGCGTEKNILLIPFQEFSSWLDELNTTSGESRFYWHVNIIKSDKSFLLYPRRGMSRKNLNKYLLKN